MWRSDINGRKRKNVWRYNLGCVLLGYIETLKMEAVLPLKHLYQHTDYIVATLKMETAYYSKTFLSIYHTTQRHNT
jgi:hypothetical protein